MENFKQYLMSLLTGLEIFLAFNIMSVKDNPSFWSYFISVLIVVGISWFILFMFRLWDTYTIKRYNKKVRKFVSSVIETVKSKYDLSLKNLNIEFSGGYIDVIDFVDNGRIVHSIPLPEYNFYKEHAEVLSLPAKQELEHLLLDFVTKYTPNNGGK